MTTFNRPKTADVAIIGAGPAGLSAARLLRCYDLSITVIDEQPRPGGQFLRQPPATFSVSHWLEGRLYARAKRTLADMEDDPGIDWRFGTTALGLFKAASGHDIRLHDHKGDASRLFARHVILAGGCREVPVAFPGWTTPGVMGTGAIQTLIKSQQVLPGSKIMLCGSHPLQLIVADQIIAAGGKVAGVTFTQTRRHALRLLRRPGLMLRNWPQLAAVTGVLARLRAARVPVLFSSTPVHARGDKRVREVDIMNIDEQGRPDPHTMQTVETDCVGLCFDFHAASELARQAGCHTFWDSENGGWLIRHDPWMRSSIPGLSVAGELTGQFGADAALDRGTVAAIGVLLDMGVIDATGAERLAQAPRRRAGRQEQFARALNAIATPSPVLLDYLATAETVICRCEGLTRGMIEQAFEDGKPIRSADAIKLFSRTGMGLCQGRNCYSQVARLIQARTGQTITDIGPYHASYPIKPVPIGSSEAATEAP